MSQLNDQQTAGYINPLARLRLSVLSVLVVMYDYLLIAQDEETATMLLAGGIIYVLG